MPGPPAAEEPLDEHLLAGLVPLDGVPYELEGVAAGEERGGRDPRAEEEGGDRRGGERDADAVQREVEPVGVPDSPLFVDRRHGAPPCR